MISDLLSILRQISEIIAKTGNHQNTLAEIVTVLAQNLGVDVCSVYEYDDRAEHLVLGATYGLSSDAVGSVTMKPGEGITGTSFKERRIINLADASSHPSFKHFNNIGEEKYQSFLAVPLTISGKCLGILTLQHVKSETFPQPVIDMVRSLSTQLANLILNARILRGLQEAPPQANLRVTNTDQVTYKGGATAQTITFGNVFLFRKDDLLHKIKEEHQQNSAAELEIFEHALQMAKKKTLELEHKALELISEADASIFNVHLMFLEDKSLLERIRKEITESGFTMEYSIASVYHDYEKKFLQFNDQTFRDRYFDLKDVLMRVVESASIIKNVGTGEDTIKLATSRLVLVAPELLPSDLIRMPVDNIAGIVCEKGGVTAHVSILAKALNIPAILGVKGITETAHNNDDIILDGHTGRVYLRPGAQIRDHFKDMITPASQAEELADTKPSKTTDGIDVMLKANISLICETASLTKYGARGVGLYRTEFMYMIRDYMPSEDDQFNIFGQVIRHAAVEEEITVRVLDIGGDKPLPYLEFPPEDNPALGYRGIRLLLDRPQMFKTHLRAILRASAGARLRLLFPMVSSAREMQQVKAIVGEVEADLHDRNLPHAENYKLGIMLEIPSVLFALDTLVNQVDFMNIGTNDLLQYSFAVDRANERVGHNADPLDPAFIRIIRYIGDFFRAYPSKQLCICGEMASITQAVPLLIGAGIYELSMPPKNIPRISKIVRKLNSKECRHLLEKVCRFSCAQDIKSEVNRFLLGSTRPL